MAKSKKPRKAYKPKPCVLPIGIRDAVKMEIPGYQASLALGQSHFVEQHIYDLLSNADMVRRIAPDGHPVLSYAQGMVEACAAIQERTQRTGKLGVTGDELHLLRMGTGKTMAYLQTVSNIEIDRAARAALREFDRTGVLKV
jgi:hypothetical protein